MWHKLMVLLGLRLSNERAAEILDIDDHYCPSCHFTHAACECRH